MMEKHRILQIVLSLAAVAALLLAVQLGVSAAEPGLPVEQEDVLAQEQPDGAVYTGTCGEKVNWSLNTSTGVLNITGSGRMYDYSGDEKPWNDYANDIKKAVIGNGVTSIGSSAFETYGALKSVTIPNSVTSIGEGAFYACSLLTDVTIPKSVTSIGGHAFASCDSLTSITVAAGNAKYCSVNGVLFNKSKTELMQYPAGNTTKSYAVPTGVKSIDDHAFAFCDLLKTVTVPDSVTSIGKSAFYYCSSLTGLTIPDSVKSIGGAAFEGCELLTSVNIPKSLTSIGDWLFAYCSSLKQAKIPNSVTSVGEGAFYCCSSLTSVTIPNSVTTMGDYAFYRCSSLKSVAIPKNMTSIGWFVFENCSSLTSVTIPVSVKSVGMSAFVSCGKLRDVYYTGTSAQWKKISFSNGNASLLNASIHYNWVVLYQVTGLTQSNHTSASVTLRWNKDAGAQGYQIFQYKNGAWTRIASTTATTKTITGLSPNSPYYFKVRSYSSASGSLRFGELSNSAATRTGPPAVRELSARNIKSNSVYLSWSFAGTATKYQIYGWNGSAWKLVKVVTTKGSTMYGLNPGTYYAYKVRALRTIGGVTYCGDYSNKITVKTAS